MNSGETISKLNRMADALWKMPKANVLSCDVSSSMGWVRIYLYVDSLEEFKAMTDSEDVVLDDEIDDNEVKPWRYVHTTVNGVEFLAIIDAAPGEATPGTAQEEVNNHSASIADAGTEVKEEPDETL